MNEDIQHLQSRIRDLESKIQMGNSGRKEKKSSLKESLNNSLTRLS